MHSRWPNHPSTVAISFRVYVCLVSGRQLAWSKPFTDNNFAPQTLASWRFFFTTLTPAALALIDTSKRMPGSGWAPFATSTLQSPAVCLFLLHVGIDRRCF
ncbi:hypothetical protein J3458_004305 [Metarhizium acridum]|uniref:uncharacterized protein n=1 Tax=Metarhizium acridum TaxID=92637 RepID=UPI001C6A9A58|nr:hypothetical protein J3458_004305 [Metarhizium acridum]